MKEKLITLKDRLNDLSRRNRSIRMLKCYDKWAFDLWSLKKIGKSPDALLEAFIHQSASKTLVEQDPNNKDTLKLSCKLTTLYRNIKSIEEETGLYDLFVGYPFISGVMLDGTYIRAPLFLYPARLIRDEKLGVTWCLEHNEEMEPLLNRTLFLSMKKMCELHVPDDIYDLAEEMAIQGRMSDWAAWLKQYGISVHLSEETELQVFQDFKKDTIPEFNKGYFQLEPLGILGHFPQGDSALLKDYEDLIEQIDEDQADFGLAGELLCLGVEDENEPQTADNLVASPGRKPLHPKSEKERFFVLDTDSSQEEIIESISDQDGLVVHGPPGTGKSQVIVNIIADAMAQGKKVLLVCQKRAALDVVYQRLDSLGLSASVGLLHDEKNDRRGFYRKLNTRLSIEEHYMEDLDAEFLSLSKKIEAQEKELNRIAHGLYEVQPYGYRAYDLYGIGKSMSLKDDLVDLSQVISELNKGNLEDILSTIFSYGSYYSRFGAPDYPLKDRKSFAKLEIKDRLKLIEILKKATEKGKQSAEYVEYFGQEGITPEYSWLIQDKLEKIYEDLDPNEKKTLQKLRLWWWTSFTGKTIVKELSSENKIKGFTLKEWPRLRESLRILYDLSQLSEKMSNEVKQLEAYISQNKIEDYGKRISKGDIPFREWEKQQEYIIQDFEELRNMDRTYDQSPEFIKIMIEELKKSTDPYLSTNLHKSWADRIEQSAYIHWIEHIEHKHPDLMKIGTESFDKLIASFRELLEKKKELSVKVLRNRLIRTLNEFKQNEARATKELVYQTGKKRRIWPVRRLVQEYSLKGLLNVMPVWLVSPETASAIFPLERELFDLVIFDEASQCTVENGLPAIFRGGKVIIAGDEKQLPPSNLFKGRLQVDEEEESELADFEESESLLNLAKRVFPNKMLQWHYRSSSEELINFSNHAYYHGNIQVAPNVAHLKEPASIQWRKVNGRWINQCNEVEATAVVDLLKELLIQYASKSIGIITFNAKQQDKIMDLVDARAEADEEFNTVFQKVMNRDLDERIFVKNIENVQGDERDIIIFSITYAKNPEGKVFNHFGTLGKAGGENRLNVAVTRAKEAIYIVSSIEPHELNVSNTKNEGPKLLKHYMEYAEAVSKLQKENIDAVLTDLNEEMNTKRKSRHNSLEFDSPFEAKVYEQLTALGYQVDTQVGMSGYRIDQAIVHPNHPDQYILGIECDGAMYHSAPSAKERDVYRQKFFEGKGWRIARIWSRNWWKNPSGEIGKIHRLIQQILEDEKSKPQSTIRNQKREAEG